MKTHRHEDIGKYYELGAVLGKGSFATVRVGTRKSDGKKFAIKVVKKTRLDPAELVMLQNEVRVMRRVVHPHCVKLEEIFEDATKLNLVRLPRSPPYLSISLSRACECLLAPRAPRAHV